MYTAPAHVEASHPVVIFGDTVSECANDDPELSSWALHPSDKTSKNPLVRISDIELIDSEPESEPEDPNHELMSQLRGRTITMSARMLSMFQDLGWPALDMNRSKWNADEEAIYQRLKGDLEEIITVALQDSPGILSKVKACDFALFNMFWHPPTDDYGILLTSSLLGTSMFIWDDYADSNEGSLGQDFDRACVFRLQTLMHMKTSLGLNAEGDEDHYLAESGPLLVFSEFARRIRAKMAQEQLQQVYHELVRFVNEAEAEHRDRLSGYVPTSVPEYLRKRFNSSGCYPGFYVLEIFNPAPPLPSWVMETQEMQTIFDEANFIISVHNDIYSCKKEVAQCCLINVIPVLYLAGCPWDQIMPTLEVALRESAVRLDEAASRLVVKVLMTSGLVDGENGVSAETIAFGVERLVNGIRYNATGNLSYGLVTRRYKCVLENHLREDGSIAMVL